MKQRIITTLLAIVLLCANVPATTATSNPHSREVQRTTTSVALNGSSIPCAGYNIGGANYFRLRDVMKALDVFVYYAVEHNLILLLTDRSYEEDPLPIATPITSKTITSISHAREDFSLQANSAVFDSTYTRGIYNLIRQVILDYDVILSNADDNGFNPYYHYPHTVSQDAYLTLNRVFSYIMAHRRYRTFSEPYLTERW